MTLAVLTDMEALKTRLKSTWIEGDYDRFSRFIQPGAGKFFQELVCSMWRAAPGS